MKRKTEREYETRIKLMSSNMFLFSPQDTYGMGHKKVPIFRKTLPCNGNFAFHVRFRSVL